MKKVNLKIYFETPERFELRKVSEHTDIPRSLVTKNTKWVGFDKKEDAESKDLKKTRRMVHIGFSVLLFIVILAFSSFSRSVINDSFRFF